MILAHQFFTTSFTGTNRKTCHFSKVTLSKGELKLSEHKDKGDRAADHARLNVPTSEIGSSVVILLLIIFTMFMKWLFALIFSFSILFFLKIAFIPVTLNKTTPLWYYHSGKSSLPECKFLHEIHETP